MDSDFDMTLTVLTHRELTVCVWLFPACGPRLLQPHSYAVDICPLG